MKNVMYNKMNIGIVLGILLISLGIGDIAPIQADVGQATPDQTEIIMPSPTDIAINTGSNENPNVTRLEIVPQYSNIRLQPGDSKEIFVTVRNVENKSVNINTKVELTNGYMDIGWITVTPAITEIPAGQMQKFAINVTVPKDASIGNSNAQIIFTDNTMSNQPMSNQPTPIYINAFQLSIDIWTIPKLQIMWTNINGQLEAGKEYDYNIKLKNIGDHAIAISPRLGDDIYYSPYNQLPIFDSKSITLTAPQSIPAGKIETINIHVKVPEDARGYYNNYINLGADDPSIRQEDARIYLSLNIWKQPEKPLVKDFVLDEKSQITIEISSSFYNNPQPTNKLKEPSFDTSIVGPNGKSEDMQVTKTIIKGNVNMGTDISWGKDGSTYQDTGYQYTFTYKTEGSPGKYELKIMPKNAPAFDYSIITENK